jgi:elongation factor Ts
MAEITAALVKELRERTGAGMMDCKRALIDRNGNMESAIEFLREKGLAAAAKKSSRIASEGLVDSYIHAGGKIGVLIEVNCETDFVAKTDEFKQLVRDLAMHIAAQNPTYVSSKEIPDEIVAKEREILRAQALNEGKPEKIVDKMVEGRIEKFFAEVCLLDQPFVRDTDITVGALITSKIASIGENINVRRFARFVLGEGLEKRVHDIAAEVAALQK